MPHQSVDDPQRPERRYQRFHALAIACLSTSILFISNIVFQHPIDFPMRVSLFAFLTAIMLVGLAYWWRNEDMKARDWPQALLLLGAGLTFGGIAAALCHVDLWFGGYFFIIGTIAVLLWLFVSTRQTMASRKH